MVYRLQTVSSRINLIWPEQCTSRKVTVMSRMPMWVVDPFLHSLRFGASRGLSWYAVISCWCRGVTAPYIGGCVINVRVYVLYVRRSDSSVKPGIRCVSFPMLWLHIRRRLQTLRRHLDAARAHTHTHTHHMFGSSDVDEDCIEVHALVWNERATFRPRIQSPPTRNAAAVSDRQNMLALNRLATPAAAAAAVV